MHNSDELFRNTGLERADKLAKDFEWFTSQGHEIPEAGIEGTTYAKYLKELSETDPPAFICHFYNVYFAHSAGGKFIGKKVCAVNPATLSLGCVTTVTEAARVSAHGPHLKEHVQLLLVQIAVYCGVDFCFLDRQISADLHCNSECQRLKQ